MKKKIIISVLSLCLLFCGHAYAEDIGTEDAISNKNTNNDKSEASEQEQNFDVSFSLTANNGEFQIVITPERNMGDIEDIDVTVWNDENGMDDAISYKALPNNDNIYIVSDNVKNHGDIWGKYLASVYIVNSNQERIFIRTVEQEIENTNIQSSSFDLRKQEISSVEIVEVNGEKGDFKALVKGQGGSEGKNKIEVAVWSTANGQDDIKWYTPKKNSEGYDELDVNIKEHNYSMGEYNVHVYLTNNETGEKNFAGATNTTISVPQKVTPILKDEKYEVTIKGEILTTSFEKIRFAVWNAQAGMGSIRWFDVKETNKNVFGQIIDIRDYRNLGTYCVHIYGKTFNGNEVFIGSEIIETSLPRVGNITSIISDNDKGKFQVEVDIIENEELIKDFSVAVWSDIKGQDDLKWYTVKKNDNGKYILDLEIKNHDYHIGVYNIHVYLNDIAGAQYFVGATNQKFELEPAIFSVRKIDEKIQIELENMIIPGGMKEIFFLTWSEVDGQDDLYWYEAKHDKEKGYTADVDFLNHRGLGKYYTHAYAKLNNNEMCFLGGIEFEAETPKINDISISSKDKMNGEFQIKLSGIRNAQLIEKIEIPVWSDEKQDDVVWYTAKKNLDGDYIVNVDIRKHNYNCKTYYAHVYLTDVTQKRYFVLGGSYSMNPEYNSMSVKDIDETEREYVIKLEGLEVPKGERGVLFAVWGDENGQNDLRWYHAERNSLGEYISSVKIREHREWGRYNIHAYIQTVNGSQQFLGATEFTLVKRPFISGVETKDINGKNGTFKVSINDAVVSSGIEKVEIPVWYSDNQSDVMWYSATKHLDGTYNITADVKNHLYHFGNYKIHVYITMGNGVRCFAGATEVNISPENYVFSRYVTASQREVVALGIQGDRVQFPTWSDANGQDDVIWYEGNNCGNGIWNVLIDSKNHRNGGNYSTHVYVTNSGQTQAIGGATYSLAWIPTDMGIMQARANLYSSSTPYLMLVNRSTHKVGIYQGWQGNWNCIQYWDCSDGAPSTPTVEGIFRVGSRGYYFDSGSSRCYWYTQFYGNYLFHSVLYSKYNGSLVDGRLGMALSHGCVRLDINNAKWIYDTIPSGTTVVVYH